LRVLNISNTRPTVLCSILVKIGCYAHLQPLLVASGWSVHQTNITQAFTHGEFDRGVEIYCYIPDGFSLFPAIRC
jgi:hypothetical protein